jgi:hypothetical protein
MVITNLRHVLKLLYLEKAFSAWSHLLIVFGVWRVRALKCFVVTFAVSSAAVIPQL